MARCQTLQGMRKATDTVVFKALLVQTLRFSSCTSVRSVSMSDLYCCSLLSCKLRHTKHQLKRVCFWLDQDEIIANIVSRTVYHCTGMVQVFSMQNQRFLVIIPSVKYSRVAISKADLPHYQTITYHFSAPDYLIIDLSFLKCLNSNKLL